MSSKNSITVWNPSDTVVIPATAVSPTDIVSYGQATLSKRDIASIVAGFQAASYEMVTTFIWTKAIVTLKKQVATLGMEFVGEMLRRPDLNDLSDPTTSIGDYEAVSLAEDLGMVTPTQGLRLKQAMQLVTHFANLEQAQAEEEQMHMEDATSILRTCITSILGRAKFDAAIQFAQFRKALGERSLTAEDGDVVTLKGSPYFFLRTTLSALLAMIKSAQGAQLEHAVGNCMLLVPLFWPRFKDPERWQVGQAYAEVSSAGNRLAISGIKRALLQVQGFDFVPESLRSNTFTETAARVLSAHFAYNNFYNETDPMTILANLGSTIPMPAFSKCMEATLAVWLGNVYGSSFNATPWAQKLLNELRPTQWEYYFNECLYSDRTVLDKLCSEPKPTSRWKALIANTVPDNINIRDKLVQELIYVSRLGRDDLITSKANQLRLRSPGGRD